MELSQAVDCAVFLFVCYVVYLVTRKQPAKTASIYSASDTAGGYGIPPDPTLHTYIPSPCEMISAAGPVQVTSRSINGLKLTELLAGGPVALGVAGIGNAGMTVVSLEEQLKTDQSQIVVIGAGMVDCLFTNIGLDMHLINVQAAVTLVRNAGKLPVLRGYNHFILNSVIGAQQLNRRDEFDQAIREEAQALGVPFLDIGSVQFDGPKDLAADQIHPTPIYHQRIATYIAKELAKI
jgi:lysophospholipase L1-like esterase